MNHLFRYAVLTWIALICFAPLSQAQGPGKRAYLAAENLRKQNKCRDAVNQYDEAIKLEPNNYKYYFQRGKCEYKLGELEMAKESFKMTVDYKQNFTPAYSLLAKLYKNEKDYGNAIYYYEEAARYENNSGRKVQYKLLLVNLLLKENRIYDAKRHVEEAKGIDPNNPNILFYNGEIASMEEDWESARRAYERALASERLKSAPPSDKAKYFYGLGLALSKLGDASGAKKAWSKANFGPYKKLISQQMMKTNHVYFYQVAVSYYLNGEYEESEDYIAQALEIQRDFSSAFVLKGKIETKRGNIGRALDHYQQAITNEKNPANRAKMYQMMANLQLNNQDYNGALRSLSQAMKIDGASASRSSVLYLKAKSEYGIGRYGDAVQTLESLLRAGVDTKSKAKYNFLLGMAAKRSGDDARASEAFKGAMYGPFKPAAKVELDKLAGEG